MSSPKWTVVALLTAGLAIAHVERVNLSVAIGDISRTFRMDAAQQGFALSAFFIPYAILQIPAGWLVDRYGVRTPYLAAFALWSAASVASAWAGSFVTLCIVRGLLGAGEAVVIPASMRYIREHFAEDGRGTAVGVLLTGAKIGPAMAFPIAASLVAWCGWRWMFVLIGLVPLPWLLAYAATVRKDDPAARRRTDLEGFESAEALPLGAVLSSPAIWGTMLGTFSYMYFFYFCVTWMPTYFRERYGLSVEATGWYAGVSFAGMAAMAVVGGKAADALIARGFDAVSVRKGFTIAGLGLATAQTLSLATGSTTAMLWCSVFGLCALGLATANYWALTQTLIPGAAVGTIVGVQNTAASVAGAAAPALTGWMISATGSLDAPVKAIGLWLALGIASYVFLVRARFAPKAIHG